MSYLDQLFGVAGKTALVTGGATGIGRMIAEALVQAGARVLIASRKGEACAKVAAEFNARGGAGSAEGFAGDIANESGIAALAAAVAERCDQLHILVNNAGKVWMGDLNSFPYAAWDSVLAVNLFGPFHLTQRLLPLIEKAARAEDPARIINVGSVAGLVTAGEGVYSYSASKAAIHHMSRVLASELAPRHITVNALAPGPFVSRMMAPITATEDDRARLARSVPIGRIGSPEDIAGAVLFLCGRSGAYVTGAVLPIDGGLSVKAPPNMLQEGDS
ncbi:MAG TPA: SDR family oxidoreductase [Xanthobacteraceae bacterium]